MRFFSTKVSFESLKLRKIQVNVVSVFCFYLGKHLADYIYFVSRNVFLQMIIKKLKFMQIDMCNIESYPIRE